MSNEYYIPLVNPTSKPDRRSQGGLLKKLKAYFLTAFVIFAYLGIANLLLFRSNSGSIAKKHKNKKALNVIFMVSDGFGPTSETFGRTYYQYVNNYTYSEQTPLDKMMVGQSRTRSANSLITDSAAGATAFSCRQKTYNYGVAVDVNKRPCATLLEAAHDKGMLTGMVVTSRITHATPASFSSHSVDRNDEDFIATWLVPPEDSKYERQVDLMFGGGYCHFIPSYQNSSCRADDMNLLENNYYTYLNDRKSFDELSADIDVLPIMGLFTPDHMSFEIDRDASLEPSLWEMSSKALELLSKNANKGFFLLIEGSKIDMAAHGNDAASHAGDILAYYKTVEVVQEFVKNNPNTLVISVSDHETGGFALGRQLPTEESARYIWYPEVINKVKRSAMWLADKIMNSSDLSQAELSQQISDILGLTDISEAELQFIEEKNYTKQQLSNFLAAMVNLRANIGWTTHGHSGVDVNLYAMGKYASRFRGNHENSEIGEILEKVLGVDLEALTEELFGDYEFPKKNETEEEEGYYTAQNFEEIHYHQH